MKRTQSKLHPEGDEIMKGYAPFRPMFLDFVSLYLCCSTASSKLKQPECCAVYSMPSSSTSNTNGLFGGIAGEGLFAP